MGLAQAWMRTESEDLLDGEHAELARRSFGRDGTADPSDKGPAVSGGNTMNSGLGGSAGETSGAQTQNIERGLGEQAPSHSGTPLAPRGASIGSGSLRDGGMENDLLLARKRRELNDAHFNRVSMSVVDVISRLDKVAEAMGVVENESRDIWGSEVSDASSNR